MPVVSVRLVGCWGVILRILLVAVGTELFEPVWPHSVATGRASGSMFARAQTIVNTWPFTDATAAAWDVVRDGGSAIDAVVEVCFCFIPNVLLGVTVILEMICSCVR